MTRPSICLIFALSTVAFASLAAAPAYADSMYGDTPTGAESASYAQQPEAPDTTASTTPWAVSVGAGAGYGPKYEGSDNYEFGALPYFDVQYEDGLFFAGMQGIGSYPIREDDYKLGAALSYTAGREESDDRQNLRGMGDVDDSVTASALAEYTVGPVTLSGDVTTALSGDYGTTIGLNMGTGAPVAEDVMVFASLGTTWADDTHMEHNFGVNARQSTNSGYRAHSAESGFKDVNASIGMNYSFAPQWGLNATLAGSYLMGDAADSPITKEEFNPSAFVAVSYTF